MQGKGFLIFLGIVAGLGLVAYFATRKSSSAAPATQRSRWTADNEPSTYESEPMQPSRWIPDKPRAERKASPVFENEQRVIVKRDAEGKIEELIIHRKVISSG
jgi:hypothetical protein